MEASNPDLKKSRMERTRTRKINLFVANIFIVCLTYMVLLAYANGVVRTLERRFGFSSKQSGLINSCNDIFHLVIIVFVSYVGETGNKPRIMCVTAMFSALSAIMNVTPHFLFSHQLLNKSNIYENYSQIESRNVDQNETDFPTMSLLTTTDQDYASKYCSSQVQLNNVTRSIQNQCSKEEASVHPAYYIFLAAQLINGIGSSAIFTLSMAYIDENSPKEKASVLLGIYTSVFSLGPVLGLFLCSLSLKLPENLLSGTSLNTTDPSFIGCWWLGYLIGGIGMAISSFLLWFHPQDCNHNRTTFNVNDSKVTKSLKKSDSHVDMKMSLQHLRGIPKALLSLLKNRLYLICVVLKVSEWYSIQAIIVQAVRYLEIHFHRSAAEGSIISGLTLAVTGLFGGITGGTLISKLKLKTTGGLKFLLVLSLTSSTGMVILINLGCPRDKMDMTMDPVIQENVVNSKCNADCQCPTSRRHYDPICGSNNISYFSPCIAGCSRSINGTFFNCKCISASSTDPKSNSHPGLTEGGTATPGYCIKSCDRLLPFMITMFVVTFAASIAKVPATMVSLRIVSDEERAFALGMQSFALNIFVFIPGPLLFGKLIDSTCLLWQRSCGTTGACLFFDTDKFFTALINI